MSERDVVWARHTWDLTNRALDVAAPTGYDLRRGKTSDRSSILTVILEAYGSDPIWVPMLDGIRRRMVERIDETLGLADAAYVIATWSNMLIGVSGVAMSHWTDQQLLTGICVVPSHQRRGVGRWLLAESLRWLQGKGLARAQVYTECDSVADRKIYPLFGSSRVVGVAYPGVSPKARD